MPDMNIRMRTGWIKYRTWSYNNNNNNNKKKKKKKKKKETVQ